MQSPTTTARRLSRTSIALVAVIALIGPLLAVTTAGAAVSLEWYTKVSRYCFGSTPYAQVGAGFSNPTSETVTYDVIFTQPDGVTMGTDRPTVAPGDTYAVSAEDLTMAGDYVFEAKGEDGSYGSITFTSVKCMIVDVQSFGATPSTIKGSIGNGSITLEVANVNRLSDSPVKFTVFAEDNPSNKKVITVDPRVPENIVIDKLGYTGEKVVVHAVYEEDGKDRDEVFTFDPIKFKDSTTPPPAPKPAKPTVQVLGGAPYKTSKVGRTCRIFNTNDKTDKAYTYNWWVTKSGRTVAKGTKYVADGKYGDVRVSLGVGTYTCSAQAADGKASKSFTVRYAPSTFSIVNKSKGKVRICHYSSSFKTGWQKPKKSGGWKSSKHWSKAKAQGSCTTRNTPDVDYGKTKSVLMTIGKPGKDVKRVVVINNRKARS